MKLIYLGLIFVVLLVGGLTSPLHAQGVQAQIPATEYNALVDIFHDLKGNAWTNSTGWLNVSASNWYGVTISGSHV